MACAKLSTSFSESEAYPMHKPTLLFDLDGTLVDSAPDLAHAINRALSTLGRDTYSLSEIQTWVGNGAKVLVERALSGSSTIAPDLDPSLSNEALELFFTYYQQKPCDKSRLYHTVKESLGSLHQKGHLMAIVTNKPERFIKPIIDSLLISNYFALSIGGDTLTERKPSAAPLLYCCEQLGVLVANCIMIGDSKNDILAAKAAGMKSIGLTYGYNYGESISQHQPEWVADRFDEILTIVDTFQPVVRPS